MHEFKLTPLFLAAFTNSTNVAQLLFQYNANIEARNVNNLAPVYIIAKENRK